MIIKKAIGLTILITVLLLRAFCISGTLTPSISKSEEASKKISVKGVCPPFYLMNERGDTIDPVHNINADRPYSPKQTCGKCHDYNKTTEGFHFQQGRGEKPDPLTAERCLWVTSPGNYGGNW